MAPLALQAPPRKRRLDLTLAPSAAVVGPGFPLGLHSVVHQGRASQIITAMRTVGGLVYTNPMSLLPPGASQEPLFRMAMYTDVDVREIAHPPDPLIGNSFNTFKP